MDSQQPSKSFELQDLPLEVIFHTASLLAESKVALSLVSKYLYQPLGPPCLPILRKEADSTRRFLQLLEDDLPQDAFLHLL